MSNSEYHLEYMPRNNSYNRAFGHYNNQDIIKWGGNIDDAKKYGDTTTIINHNGEEVTMVFCDYQTWRPLEIHNKIIEKARERNIAAGINKGLNVAKDAGIGCTILIGIATLNGDISIKSYVRYCAIGARGY